MSNSSHNLCEHGLRIVEGCEECGKELWTNPIYTNAYPMLRALKLAEQALTNIAAEHDRPEHDCLEEIRTVIAAAETESEESEDDEDEDDEEEQENP